MLSALIEHGHGLRLLELPRGPLTLHCMARGAGFERRFNEAYSWEGLKRGAQPFALIQHTVTGRGELDFEGTHHALEVGDTMLLTFPHRNRYWLAPGRSWEYFWITLTGREALRIARAVIDANGPVIRPGSEAIDRLAASCLALLEGEIPSGAASAAAYAGIMAVHDGARGDEIPDASNAPAAVLRVQRFVAQNLAGNLGIERLARVAQVSRAHFVRLFTTATGIAPSDYVFAERMQRAERLLIATDSGIGEIAASCGFADANYFAKAFRRAHGTTPSEFRASAHRGV
ncbi:MAG TPA: AraC family transcriptional regulator [Devosia sp.]